MSNVSIRRLCILVYSLSHSSYESEAYTYFRKKCEKEQLAHLPQCARVSGHHVQGHSRSPISIPIKNPISESFSELENVVIANELQLEATPSHVSPFPL